MSTTGGGEAGTVYVLDEPDRIRKKFRSAVTDSGREVRRAGPEGGKEGIENLIEILCVVRGVGPEAIEAEFADSGYGDFKAAVGDAVAEYLAPVRERYAELASRSGRARAGACRRVPRRRGRSPRRSSPTSATRWASPRPAGRRGRSSPRIAGTGRRCPRAGAPGQPIDRCRA